MKVNEIATKCKNKMMKVTGKACAFYHRHQKTINRLALAALVVAMCADMGTIPALADPTPTPTLAPTPSGDPWSTVVDTFVLPWVKRIGGAVAFVGAVEFGYGQYADDGNAKTKGVRIAIAGAIIFAVGAGGGALLG